MLLHWHHNEEVMVWGSQAGQAYNQRSNAKISHQNWGQEAAAPAYQATAQPRCGFMHQHFFAPAAQQQSQQWDKKAMAQQNNPATAQQFSLLYPLQLLLLGKV
jgi:hypothetical protein